jgi:hypothetical protein
MWRNTFLFASTGTALERQKNMCQIENLIREGILQGVRSMLPVKSILREYLSTDETDDEEEEEEEDEDEEEEKKEEVAELNKSPTKPVDIPTGPANIPTGPANIPVAPAYAPTGPTNFDSDLNLKLKEFDIAAPIISKSSTPVPSRPSTPVPTKPATPPVVPTIILDGAPRVEFKETESFFPKQPTETNVLEEADINELEEVDISEAQESTSLDFSEFEVL